MTSLLEWQGLKLDLLSDNVQEMVDQGPMVKYFTQDSFHYLPIVLAEIFECGEIPYFHLRQGLKMHSPFSHHQQN